MTVIYINFSMEEMIISFINILKFKKFKTKPFFFIYSMIMYYFNYLRKFILNNIVKDEIRVNQMGELNKWLKFV